VEALTVLRAHDALRWAAVGGLAVVALVCCFVPSIEIGLSGFVGAGETQRVFDAQRDVALVPGLLPRSLVIVVPALALLAASVAGLLLGSRRWVAVTAFVAGLALATACYRLETHFTAIEPGAVLGCDAPCAGFVLGPEADELRAELRRTPAGHRPDFELTGGRYGYNAHAHGAWRALLASGLALGLLGGYAFARLAVRPWPAVVVVATVALLVFVWLLLRSLSRLE